MHTTRILLLCGLLTCASVQAGTYEWTSGWGMGVSEHLVDDGNGNELNISCPEYARKMAMSVPTPASVAGSTAPKRVAAST